MSNPDNKELLPPKTCKWCGFEIADRARGTFTAWLFREVCKCEYQQELQLDENASVTPSAEPVQSTTSSFRLGDRYTVLSVLGRGGMGTVVKVRERSSGATLAIKILHVELCQDEISRKRFEREIEAAMSLDHVNLVTVRGHGSTEDGRPFYIMDLIVGKGLSTILAEEKTIEPIRLINIVSQISHALEHVHSHGIVHRDLKPSNIMLVIGHGEKDLVKLVDFGIAKVVRGGERQSNAELNTLTESGEIFGSPLYMSPEQCMGRQLDARSDLYALGCVVYECLTGFPPFPGKNPVETILGHLNDTPKKITVDSRAPDVVQRLENITLKCLAKRVEDRYASVNELIDDLERVRAGLPPAARPRRSRWILKQKKVWIAISLAVLLVVAVSVPFLANLSPKDRPEIAMARWTVHSSDANEALNKGNYAEGKQFLLQALKEARVINSKSVTAATLEDLSDLYAANNENDLARETLRQAKDLYSSESNLRTLVDSLENASKKVSNPISNKSETVAIGDLLTKSNNAAYDLLESERVNEAKQLVALSVDLAEKTEGKESEQFISALRNKGHLLFLQRRYEEAEDCFKNILSHYDSKRIIFSSGRARTLTMLARIYILKGKFPQVKELLEKNLEISLELWGSASEQVAEARIELADCLVQMDGVMNAGNELKKARQYFDGNPKASPKNRARLHFLLGKIAGNADEFKEALKIYQQNLPRDNRNIAKTLVALGDCVGQPRAKPLYKRAFSISTRLDPPDDLLNIALTERL